MVEVEQVIFQASVVDDFTQTLEDLSDNLRQIGAEAEAVDPIDIDTQISEALAETELIRQRLDSLDRKTARPEVEVDWDRATSQELFNLMAFQDRDVGRGLFDWDPGDNPFDTIDTGGSRMAGGMPFGFHADNAKDTNLIDLSLGNLFDTSDPHARKPIKQVLADFGELRLTMGFFMNLLASLLPLLGVFIGALPAAIGGLMGLATAALAASAAILGVGGLAMMGMMFQGGEMNFDEIKQEIQSAFDVFKASFVPISEALVPLARDAFDSLEFAIRDTASRLNGLFALTDEARSVMRGLSQWVGRFVQRVIALGEASMGMLNAFGSGVLSIDYLALFADILSETAMVLSIIWHDLEAMMPAIYEMSQGFLIMSAVLIAAASALFQFVSLVPGLAEGLGIVIPLLFTAISASALYTIAVSNLAGQVYMFVGNALPAFLSGLHSIIAAEIGATGATIVLGTALLTLIGIVTFGVVPAIMSAAGGFATFDSEVSSAAESLRQFSSQSRRASGARIGYGSSGRPGGGPHYGSAGETVIVAPDKETGTAVANTANFGSRTTNDSDVDNSTHS